MGNESTVQVRTPMGSIANCLCKYIDFSGRSTRAEYWWFFGFVLVVLILAELMLPRLTVLLIGLLLGLPLNAASARRLRDSGKSPWLVLLALLHIPGALVLAYLCMQPSLDDTKSPIAHANGEDSVSDMNKGSESNRINTLSPIHGLPRGVTGDDTKSSDRFSYMTISIVSVGAIAAVILVYMIQSSQTQRPLNQVGKKEPVLISSTGPVAKELPIAVSKFHSWSPSGERHISQKVVFGGGMEVFADQSLGVLTGAVLRLRAGEGEPYIATEVENDFVKIEAVIPRSDNPLLAVIKSNCGGSMCHWSEYSVAYLYEDKLQITSIGPILNSDFRIVVETIGQKILSIRIEQMADGSRNKYGDLLTSNRNLVFGKGFLVNEFSNAFFSLVDDQAAAFFSHPTAREKLAQAMGFEQFRELRSYGSGPSGRSKVADGRYLVFNACVIHSCDSKFSTVIFDGVTGDSWAIWVDAQSSNYWSGSSVPWSVDLLNSVKPLIQLGDKLEPTLDNGRIKLVSSASRFHNK